MPYTNSDAYDRLVRALGYADDPVHPLVHVRSPFRLSNGTLPVLEGVMIGGAGLALVNALDRRRRGDPTGMAVWAGSVAYLLAVEPPLYFPDAFHLPESVRDVFAHNVFSVQLLYEHLPLYIVALYPAMASLAYEIVDALGMFDDGTVLAAVCVGFVHHLFYEIFDHLGPQLAWWIWNPAAETNTPALGSVPLTSMFLFATAGPAALALLARLIVGRRADRGEPIGAGSLAVRSLAVGALVPLCVAVAGLPSSLLGAHRPRAQGVVMSGLLGLSGAVAVPALARVWRRGRAAPPPRDSSWFAVGFGSVYLAAFGLLWRKALPDHLAARDGVTAGGTATGSLGYAAGCAGLAVAAVAAVATVSGRGRRWVAALRPAAGSAATGAAGTPSCPGWG